MYLRNDVTAAAVDRVKDEECIINITYYHGMTTAKGHDQYQD